MLTKLAVVTPSQYYVVNVSQRLAFLRSPHVAVFVSDGRTSKVVNEWYLNVHFRDFHKYVSAKNELLTPQSYFMLLLQTYTSLIMALMLLFQDPKYFE